MRARPREGGPRARALRPCAALVSALACCVFTREARAQLRADEVAPEAAAVTAEVPLDPAPGRVAVEVSVSRTPDARVGFEAAARAPVAPLSMRAAPAASIAAVFTREPHPHHCNAPCTAYLRPGLHRIFLDAGTDFSWRVDVPVPELGETRRLRVRLRGHAFAASFAAGPLVIVGAVATLAGPGAIIVGAAVGDHTVPIDLWITGTALFLAGGSALALGAGLFRYAAPRVEGVDTVDTVESAAPREPERTATGLPTVAFAPAPGGASALLRW